jgi:putative SOS response-associated peptidase YedK
MCGRYSLKNSSRVKEIYNLDLKPRYNIAPSQKILTVTDKPQMMKWSYSPSWAKKPMNLINARSETLSEKPSFREAKRCVIVADGWFEWKKEAESKIPYYHHLNGEVFHFAGLYNPDGCLIVTKEACSELSHIHGRMPVLVEDSEIGDWLGGKDLFASPLSNLIHTYPVSKHVNNPRNDDENCCMEMTSP